MHAVSKAYMEYGMPPLGGLGMRAALQQGAVQTGPACMMHACSHLVTDGLSVDGLGMRCLQQERSADRPCMHDGCMHVVNHGQAVPGMLRQALPNARQPHGNEVFLARFGQRPVLPCCR